MVSGKEKTDKSNTSSNFRDRPLLPCVLYFIIPDSFASFTNIAHASPKRNQDAYLWRELRSHDVWHSIHPRCPHYDMDSGTRLFTANGHGLLRFWRLLYRLGWYDSYILDVDSTRTRTLCSRFFLTFVINVFFCLMYSRLLVSQLIGISWDNGAAAVPLSETPIVYNINLTRWTSNFVPRGKETPTTTVITNSTAVPTEPTAPAGSTEPGVANPVTGEETTITSSQKAAIIGGSVGGGIFLIFLIVCGVYLCRRHRRVQQQKLHKQMLEEPTKKIQFRIVQQPATDATIEPTFYPTRPFRITPPTTPKKSKQKLGDRSEKDRLNSPTHWNSSHSHSDRSLSSPSTSTLVTSNIDTNTKAKILPQHIITLDRFQAQRNQ